MPRRHIVLAIIVSVIWGVNFVAIHASLQHFPPLFLAALRFTAIAIPTVLFVPRPEVKKRWIVGYGLGFGTAQFVGLYIGMALGFPAGLASVVLQSSAPFTVILSTLIMSERLSRLNMIGLLIAIAGLGLVGTNRAAQTSWIPFCLVLFGGFGWALGNLASRQASAPKPFHLTLWMCTIPPIPLLGLSLATEGPAAIGHSLATSLDPSAGPAWAGLTYTVLVGTIVGSGLWVWLMSRHPASIVAPFSMLVPVTGLAAGWLLLHQKPHLIEVLGSVLVAVGVIISAQKSLLCPAIFKHVSAIFEKTSRGPATPPAVE